MTKYIGEKLKKDVVEVSQLHDKDTGSSEVQITVLTSKINHLVEHLKEHKKDNHTRRGLLLMVSRRRRLVNYLKKKKPAELTKLAKKLKLKV
eukprot:COSAG01_NODE_4_length_55812_cov_1344.168109_45_plen_92_part_00